jgi:hypothetical protein
VFASPESVKLAQDLGVAAEQTGHENNQEADNDRFDDDESFHYQSGVVGGGWWVVSPTQVMW